MSPNRKGRAQNLCFPVHTVNSKLFQKLQIFIDQKKD